MEDTICAVSTAPGAGGIAVIRISGPEAIAICNTIFVPRTAGKGLLSQKAYTLRYGSIRRGEELIDEVLIALFRAPHSFTGEDTVEITCHGSVYIQQQIMQLLIERGCRSALPGEYTQRAFMNGKMDLSQAEAVADLIASTSAGQHRLALNQMRGGFSHELKNLREQLLHITSLMELELDFSDHEELEFADRSELSTLAAHIETVISRLANSFSVGNAIKNGIPVAIIGETNAGKSTLLNVLLNEDRRHPRNTRCDRKYRHRTNLPKARPSRHCPLDDRCHRCLLTDRPIIRKDTAPLGRETANPRFQQSRPAH